MICKNCNSETKRSITIVREGKIIDGCPSCIHLTPLYPNNMHDEKNTTLSIAHRNDIRRRKLDRVTGEIYQDYGRKSFVNRGINA